jgi:aminomethyltransferase
MPVEYSGITREHNAVRTAAGLFDVSHMGEVEVRGPHAEAFIQFITSNDVTRLADGQAQYSAMPYPEGTVVDDILVYRFSSEHFMLVLNAGNTAKDIDWITSHNTFGASVSDISSEVALLAIQGPKARDVLACMTEVELSQLGYYRFRRGDVGGAGAIVSRTGYTGEDGFEIYLPAEHAESVWTALLNEGESCGLIPAGLGARNTLRLEAGFLLYGNDMDETTTLLEAGLGWIVRMEKGDFIGREPLLRQKNEGVKRKLVGFEMMGREIAREHYPVFAGGKESGHVTSGSPSITLRKNIGLAYLPVEHSKAGTAFQISVRDRKCDAQVVQTPFYKRS